MIIAAETDWREAIDAHKGERFVWVEPRMRELLPSKVLSLASKEDGPYQNLFFLGKTGTSGIYPPEAWWLIPKGVGISWVRKHLADLIAVSDLIPDSPPEEGNVFFHSGDLGDCIASLPVIRQLGGGKLVIGHQPGVGNREAMRGARFDALRPLLEAQDYITSVEYDDEPQGVTHNCATFRHHPIRGESLAHWQARHLGVTGINLEPWLSVPEPIERHGKVVMSRSHRYHGRFFPWAELLTQHKGNTVFVGLESEHIAFQHDLGCKIPYQHTANLLDLAKLIAGCSLFVGNQSAPYWIAVGLGVPGIQESYERDPNSVIARPNWIYTRNGQEARVLLARLRKNKRAALLA